MRSQREFLPCPKNQGSRPSYTVNAASPAASTQAAGGTVPSYTTSAYLES
jgi:hypothetical protein